MTRVLVYITILAALLAAVGGVYTKGYISGKNACTVSTQTKIVKELTNEAQSFANRPRTRADRVDRLCQWRADVAKDKGQPLAGLSAEPCP